MISSNIQALFKIEIQPNMSEQDKKRRRIDEFVYLQYTKKIIFFLKKSILRKRWEWRWNKNEKKAF